MGMFFFLKINNPGFNRSFPQKKTATPEVGTLSYMAPEAVKQGQFGAPERLGFVTPGDGELKKKPPPIPQ